MVANYDFDKIQELIRIDIEQFKLKYLFFVKRKNIDEVLDKGKIIPDLPFLGRGYFAGRATLDRTN